MDILPNFCIIVFVKLFARLKEIILKKVCEFLFVLK